MKLDLRSFLIGMLLGAAVIALLGSVSGPCNQWAVAAPENGFVVAKLGLSDSDYYVIHSSGGVTQIKR
ncbi:MAG: hypothetical protein JXA82_20150 [Sedimentisphaerales bacterium]|nr:hypothetical protein [Sedimentisphaerales bacterium]